MNTLADQTSVVAPDRPDDRPARTFAAAVALLIVVTGLNLWNTIQLGSMAGSLRAERQRIETLDQSTLDQQVRLDMVRQRLVAQHADLIAQQTSTAKLSAENLRLATELNARLKRSD